MVLSTFLSLYEVQHTLIFKLWALEAERICWVSCVSFIMSSVTSSKFLRLFLFGDYKVIIILLSCGCHGLYIEMTYTEYLE